MRGLAVADPLATAKPGKSVEPPQSFRALKLHFARHLLGLLSVYFIAPAKSENIAAPEFHGFFVHRAAKNGVHAEFGPDIGDLLFVENFYCGSAGRLGLGYVILVDGQLRGARFYELKFQGMGVYCEKREKEKFHRGKIVPGGGKDPAKTQLKGIAL